MPRPPRLSRTEVVAAARRVLERDGVGALTMRRVAAEVGSAPMALYHHVRDKDELLALLLDDHAAAIRRPAPEPDPRRRLLAAAEAMHGALAALPWVVEVLTADDFLSTSALWFPEAVVEAGVACGLAPDDAVRAYRTIWYYTVGEILVRATSQRRRRDDRPTHRDAVLAALDPADTPHLAAVAGRWARLTAEDTYRRGLEALVDGLLPRPAAPGG